MNVPIFTIFFEDMGNINFGRALQTLVMRIRTEEANRFVRTGINDIGTEAQNTADRRTGTGTEELRRTAAS